MKLLLRLVVLLCTFGIVSGQECNTPMLIAPLPGAIDVSLDTSIRWKAVEGVPGYLVSLGTTPGGTELLNRQQVGSATSYTPPTGLPESTRIYVTITLYFFEEGVPEVNCTSDTFITAAISSPPSCIQLLSPADGSTGVPVRTQVRWSYTPGAATYRLEMGTSPGNYDLYDVKITDRLSFLPPDDLPEDREIYLRITPVNRFGEPAGCSTFSFTTGSLGELPACSRMLSPANGATNVSLNPILEWEEVPGADGYRVTIGNSPYTSEILSSTTFYSTSTQVIDFEPNRSFFISIIPFNNAGEALGCTQESFSTILGCGPYFDQNTGELVDHDPRITVPDTLAVCTDSTPYRSPDEADGYRWYQLTKEGSEIITGEEREITFEVTGTYIYEVYNQLENGMECRSRKIISVVASGLPRAVSVSIGQEPGGMSITALAEGPGEYIYSIYGPDGPWQETGNFSQVPGNLSALWVKDQQGCGVIERQLSELLLLNGFPKYFTPNGDGTNEYWQFKTPPGGKLQLRTIEVFDRYGRSLAVFTPGDKGWDGTSGGRLLPASNYWYKATGTDGSTFTGFFLLKR